MTIATFNAAGLRARLPIVLEWLAEKEPDVLVIQETKVEDAKFPAADIEEAGYGVVFHGQKAWNGVAILSKTPVTNVRSGFMDDLWPNDARIISCEVGGVAIVNTYVPNGNTVGSEKFEYKLKWLERFDLYLRQNYRPDAPLVWLGDINIAPKPDDVYNSKRFYGGVGHHPDEFSRLEKIVSFGLTDLFRMHHPEPAQFTFWDFLIPNSVERNLGWRIDHIYGTAPIAEACTDVRVDIAPRKGERPSDHTFVYAELDL